MLDHEQQRKGGSRGDPADRRRNERRRAERRRGERRASPRRAAEDEHGDPAGPIDGVERRRQDRRTSGRRAAERRKVDRRRAERRHYATRRRRYPLSESGFLTAEERQFLQSIQEGGGDE